MAKDPSTVTQRWVQNLGGATAKYTEGIQGVSVAPGAAAARQANVWLQNTQASQAKYARNVAAVPLSAWQDAAINKGAGRLASGATTAAPKMQAFLTKFLPAVESARSSLPPRGTDEQNKTRLVAFLDKMHQFQK